MKKFKILSLVLTFALACSMLTGCIGNVGEIKINENGSGHVKMSFGFEENIYKSLQESMSEEGTTSEESDTETFVYNGVTYIGSTTESDFSNLDELNALLISTDEENSSGGMNVETGAMTFSKGPNGEIIYELKTTAETGNTSEIKQQYAENLTVEGDVNASVNMDPETEAALEEMMKTMAIVFEITFPYNVEMTTGEKIDGITINGKELKIDFIKAGEALNGKEVEYKFVASPNGKTEPVVEPKPEPEKVTGFTDVKNDAWYYKAVNALSEGGLVAGVGNNKFAPQDTLTYAQFCQIVARAEGLETGEANGYWAYKAIKSCREKGYIVDLGDYTPANYDVPMPREAAVAGMFRAKATEYYSNGKVGTSIKDTDIPDFKSIDDNYKNDILDAYNSGITNGMDAKRTFNPKGILTRAEVCQLFYNVNWTTAAK